MLGPLDALALATAGVGVCGALGGAASGLVDATKAFWGGVSVFGVSKLQAALDPFGPALENAVAAWPHIDPADQPGGRRARTRRARWRGAIRANWINGGTKLDQKAAAVALLHVGFAPEIAEAVASAGRVDAAILKAAMTAIAEGSAPSAAQANILQRFDAAFEAAFDAAFEEADQQYRNASKLISGAVAVGLTVWGGALVSPTLMASLNIAPRAAPYWSVASPELWTAVLLGLIAVPLAPVAKDLSSSLQASSAAMKTIAPAATARRLAASRNPAAEA